MPALERPEPPENTDDVLTHLRHVGIGYSVTDEEIRGWLDDSGHTPYAAYAEALLQLLHNRCLRREIPIDTIRSIYENDKGMTSPRTAGEVDLGVLADAVVQDFNSRYEMRVDSLIEACIPAT